MIGDEGREEIRLKLLSQGLKLLPERTKIERMDQYIDKQLDYKEKRNRERLAANGRFNLNEQEAVDKFYSKPNKKD